MNDDDYLTWQQGRHKTFFTYQQFWQLIQHQKVVDGRGGGLVVGRLHSEGNIYFFKEEHNGFRNLNNHNLQGGEFIINRAATAKYGSRIEQINREVDRDILYGKMVSVSSLLIKKDTRILNTHGEPEKLLWLDHHQFIVNHLATLMHYNELVEINSYQK